VTDVASGEPVGVSVWLVPEIVTGPMLLSEALPDPASVRERDPPLHAEGIDPRAIEITTPSTTVQEIVMPLSDPQELTLVDAPTTLLDVVVVLLAIALLGRANVVATTIANAGRMRMVG
jgi:hypothetical protein